MNGTLKNVLERLSGVSVNGDPWKALCPAHSDKRPSLSIKNGTKGILIKCWAGCALEDIVAAIGISTSDLFFEQPKHQSCKSNGTQPERANLNYRWPWRNLVNELQNIAEVRSILAKDFLEQAKCVDVRSLTDTDRDRLLEKIFLAMSWIQLGKDVDELAFQIRRKMRGQEILMTSGFKKRRAAAA